MTVQKKRVPNRSEGSRERKDFVTIGGPNVFGQIGKVEFQDNYGYNYENGNSDLGGAKETPSKKQWQQAARAVLRDLEGLPIETIEDVRGYIARVRDKPLHARDEAPKKREERRKAEEREGSPRFRQDQNAPGLADAFEVAHSVEPAELWADRDGTENPVEFIQRVYEKELGSLTRAALSRVDYRLYQAYAKWLERHPNEPFRLRTQPQPPRVAEGVTVARIRRQKRDAARRLRERRMQKS